MIEDRDVGLARAYLVIGTFGAVAEVAGVDGDYVASLISMPEIDDIFGSGATVRAAQDDLMVALQEARSHLAGFQPELSPRLARQLSTLEKLFGSVAATSDSRRDVRFVRSSTALAEAPIGVGVSTGLRYAL